jgi:uncharacterized protein (DUF488 family)
MKIFTIGHSTRDWQSFLELLKQNHIELLIDVRRFPTSKRYPHFNREFLEKHLPIDYIHYEQLGGYRKGGYDAFTKTKEFRDAVDQLLKIIGNRKAVIMCAEKRWFTCHRRYIATYLTSKGHRVIHIWDKAKLQEHKLTEKIKNIKPYCDAINKAT